MSTTLYRAIADSLDRLASCEQDRGQFFYKLVRARDMRIAALLILALAPAVGWSGPEFYVPKMREGTAYDSTDPRYRAIGIEEDGELYIVADSASVLDQKTANRIIRDIRRRNITFTDIVFYTTVRDIPRFPSFAIYDFLAGYSRKDNKVHYGVAAKNLYGGWAHGPTP